MSRSPSPRRAAILALTAVLALTGCREQQLYSGLSQREANEMMALLQSAGFQARVVGDGKGHVLHVPQAQLGDAVRMLSRAGLPREKSTTLTDILPRDSYMISPTEDRARLAHGMAQELTNTLMQVAGVTQARVHLALAEKNALGQIVSAPSASVLIRHNPDLLRPDFQDTVRALVSSSVAGLAYDRVTVALVPDQTATVFARAFDTPATTTSTAQSAPVPQTVMGLALAALFGLLALGAMRLFRSREGR